MPVATSYNAGTNREDISDDMTIFEPEDTPFLSSLPKGKIPKAVYTEWPIDNLSAVRVERVPEGHDVTEFENAVENRTRIGNNINITERTWRVSDLQERVESAGPDDDVSQSKVKKLKELKRDIAALIGGDYEAVDSGPNYGARGIGNWILNTAQAVHPVPTAFRTPAASISTTAMSSFAESDVNGVLASIYRQGGNRANGKLFVGVNLKQAFSNFSRVSSTTRNTLQVTQPAESKKIILNVTAYEGDFGMLDLIPDLFLGYGASTTQAIRDARGYYIDTGLVSMKWMEAPYHTELEDQGGGKRGFYKTMFTLKVSNPLGLGKFAATS
jgi:hypothetical protein